MNSENLLTPILEQVKTFSRPARLFLLAILIDGISYCSWLLFFNFYILARGYDKAYLGLVNAAPSIGMLVLGLPMGRLSDRIGRKWAMIVGATIAIGFMGLEVLLNDPRLIVLAAFISGAGASLYVLSHAPFMMKASTPQNRDMLFSLAFGLLTIAGAVGNLFSGLLPGLFSGLLSVPGDSAIAYQWSLLVGVAAGLLLVVPLLMMEEPSTNPEGCSPAPERVSALAVVRQPLTIKLALPILLIGLGAAILLPYTNLFYAERFGMSTVLLGLLYSLAALLTCLSSLFAPQLAVWLGGKIRAVVFTQASSLLFMLLMGFAPFVGFSAGAYLLRGMLMNMAYPLMDSFSMGLVPEGQQGTVNSVRGMANQVGWAIGPFISGLIQERSGFAPLFVIATLLYAVATGATWKFFHKVEPLVETVIPEIERMAPDALEIVQG